MNRLHLICNAHIDPVWQWEWEEGAAAALSTFRAAADFCEEYEGLVFNHNEALLYKWIEEYEPALFQRIQKLVMQGRWHIVGGWYLQPDCNMPSGESIVRQILYGKRYFKDKFGVEPSTAVNLDSFGHSRGLVQILAKSGFDSYLYCRPGEDEYHLESSDFIWVGYDGSEILTHRAFDYYNSKMGEAVQKVNKWLGENPGKDLGLILWGVGNHGGGPSRIDINDLNKLVAENNKYNIFHSIPEEYFRDLKNKMEKLPHWKSDLNPHAVGCYTAQVRIKQKHRLLESELLVTEKMLSSASLQCFLNYPQQEINKAFHDLMVSQFHDILPGSSVQPAEEKALGLLDHGLEISARLKARAFFALSSGQKKAEEGEFPILIYNPHPFRVQGIFECEFQLPVANPYTEGFSLPLVYQNGMLLPCQVEKELGNMKLDWRKRVVFEAALEPSAMNRFDCRLKMLPQKPQTQLKQDNDRITFKSDELEVIVNCKTGFIDRYAANNVVYLRENSFMPVVIDDQDNPWAHSVRAFERNAEPFVLMNRKEGSAFSGIRENEITSVRVIEDGPVRIVIEAVLRYGDSFICQHYKLPRKGTEIQIQTRVYWNEKSKLLKLSIPTLLMDAKYMGQDMFGVAELLKEGREVVSQKWTGVVSQKEGLAFTCINDGIYASDFMDGEIRLSLLRSPAYTAFSVDVGPTLADDRFIPRMDQGERIFNFWLKGGEIGERLENIDHEALVHNEKPYALSYFPSGEGIKPLPLIMLEGDTVQLTAFKKAEGSDNYVVRLFEPAGKHCCIKVHIPVLGIEQQVKLESFEIKTFILNIKKRVLAEASLTEEQIV